MDSEDVRTGLTIGQAVWGVAVSLVTLGSAGGWVVWNIKQSNRRHEGHDKKFKEQDEKIDKLAKKDDLELMKSDIIREVYALHGVDYDSLPRVVDRRQRPR